MAINERVITGTTAAAAPVSAEAEQNLILHLDANDVDSYDGDGSVWYDISEHDVTIPLSDNADDLELHLNASDTTSYDPATDTTTWTDISGNSNDATLTSLTNTDHDIDNGGYFEFDGASDYASISATNTSPINFTDEAFTLEAWVNIGTFGVYEGIICRWNTSAFQFRLNLGETSPYKNFEYVERTSSNTNATFASSTTLEANRWYHLVVTRSASQVTMYIDGEQDFQSSATNDIRDEASSPIRIGHIQDGPYSFDGKIGAVRIYSKVLSASEVGQNYRHGRDYIYTDIVSDSKLHLDPTSYSGSGSTWTADAGNDATISGASYDEELGDWFDFDGSNDYVEVSPIPSGIQNDTILTGEAWIYAKSATNNSIISFRGSTSTSIKFFLAANSSGQLYLVASSTSTFLSFGTTASNVVPTNKWTHVAATINYSTKDYAIYVNGEEVSSGTQSNIRGATTFNASNFYIGTNLVGTQHSNLRIGQVRLYSSALTQAQVRQNYNFTKNDYPNGFNGTISNTTWNSSGYFDFNGSSSKIELPDVPTFDRYSEIKAVSAWVKLDTTTSRVFPLSISSTTNANDYWYFGWLADLGKIYVATRDGSSSNQSFATATVTADTNWHHIFCQLTDTTREIYLDGVKQTVTHTKAGTGADTSWISYPSYATNAKGVVGILRLASPQYSNGFISDVKAYTKILTQTEITAEYNKGQFGAN